MIDVFDIMAFAVFGVLLAVAVVLVITLGQLPGRKSQNRGHPQTPAIIVASWFGAVELIIRVPSQSLRSKPPNILFVGRRVTAIANLMKRKPVLNQKHERSL